MMGSARDIVEECGVPRFLFVDFPLGNPCGRPGAIDEQRTLVGMAMDLLEGAIAPRTTVQAPVRWDNDGWRERFMYVGDDNREDLAVAGEARRVHQEEIRQQDLQSEDARRGSA